MSLKLFKINFCIFFFNKSLKKNRLIFLIILFTLLISSCYSIKNNNNDKRINLQIFKNDTNIFGLENELAQYLPSAFRKETGFRTGNTNFGYIVKGKIETYKKKVIRKSTNGDPTHQQVTIEVLLELCENDKVLNSQKITNTSYRIDSGLYNYAAGENENFGRQNALIDISELIAQSVNYYFLEK